jgi:hypothetical protein
MIRARPPQHQNLDLHLHQPFFFQFGCGKRALLFLVPVGPAVLRPRRLKFANRASCTRISVIFFQKTGFWPLGWRGICSSCLASRHRWSARRRGPTSTALNFWKKIPENRAGQHHISQAGKTAGNPADRPQELSPGSSKPRRGGWRGRSWAYFGSSFPQPSPDDHRDGAGSLGRHVTGVWAAPGAARAVWEWVCRSIAESGRSTSPTDQETGHPTDIIDANQVVMQRPV